jgi:hypothetical protein
VKGRGHQAARGRQAGVQQAANHRSGRLPRRDDDQAAVTGGLAQRSQSRQRLEGARGRRLAADGVKRGSRDGAQMFPERVRQVKPVSDGFWDRSSSTAW